MCDKYRLKMKKKRGHENPFVVRPSKLRIFDVRDARPDPGSGMLRRLEHGYLADFQQACWH